MSKHGLFIGLCGLDVVFYEKNKFPVEDTKMKCEVVKSAIGGPAANAAITFSLLGGKSTIISYIGNSNVGKLIKSMLSDMDIKVIDMCDDEDVKCISSIYVNTVNATRTIFSGRNEIHSLKSFIIVEETIKNADFILYDGHFSSLDDVIVNSVKKHNKEWVIDVGGYKDSFEKLLDYNPILVASAVFQNNGLNGITMMKNHNYNRAVITNGKNPIEYQDGDIHGWIDIIDVDALDTLGAGDIYHGAFCYYYFIKALNFVKAIECASHFASKSTERFGVIDGIKHSISTFGK